VSISLGVNSRPDVRLLYRGAEADIILGEWQGLPAVFKVRKPLPYRLPVLDDAIRRHRTIHEAGMLHGAKLAGVRVPHLYSVDVPDSTIVMEFIPGERLKDLVDTLPKEELMKLFFDFGHDTGSLHAAGIMHGDLTTANVIASNGRLVFIDFGLAVRTSRIEDRAVDLRLIKETIVGAHPGSASTLLDAVMNGYETVVGQERFRSAIRQLRSIERRGRYARVT
jgi:TP53 regulating kinase and related kinases